MNALEKTIEESVGQIEVHLRGLKDCLEEGVKKLSGSSAKMSRGYVAVRKGVERMEEQVKTLTTIKDKLKKERVPEALDADDVTSVTIETPAGRYRIVGTSKMRASIKKDKKDEAYEWLEENGYSAIIKPTVNAESLSSLAGEHLEENGEEFPEEMFNQYVQRGTSVTSVKT